MTNTGLISLNEYESLYNEAYYAWDQYFPEADLDLRFMLGDQWTQEEKRKLYDQGRNAFVFNKIRSGINLITGYQRQNRLSTVVSPVLDGSQKTADQYSQCVLHAFNYDNAYNTISDAFGSSVVSGFSLVSVYHDYSQDPINGDIRFRHEPWNTFICDPYFTKRDFSDCNYIIRRRYVSQEQAEMLLPKKESLIKELRQMGWERDEKFSWMPYQRQPSYQEHLLAYDEIYRRETVQQNVILNTETNQMVDFDGSKEQFEQLQMEYPQLEMIKRSKYRIRLDVMLNNEPVHKEYNPQGLDVYPFVPFIPVFYPESDQWDLKVQGLVRQLRDPQREANRRRSQMIDILDSQINSGYIADENSVVNPRSLYQSGQGKVIWRKKGSSPNSIEKQQPAQIPPSWFQLQELFDSDMNNILGLNDAAFGRMESAGESGVMQMLRQSAAITSVQDVFDNLRLSQKLIGKLVMKMVAQWSPEKVMRITGEQPTEDFYSPDFTKYDAVVQEGMLTDTQRQMFFRQLLDLKQLGEPIPPLLLAKSAPIQGKSEYYEQMEEYLQQQQQAEQKQAEEQQMLMQAQADLARSRSIEQMAGAKERFTRATANLGLQDERASEAIQNRNQATLDQVRAMKEIEQMDLDTLEKVLRVTELMNMSHKQEEEETKAQDVAITELADQEMGQQMSNNIMGGGGMNPQQEVING